jgi:hypothetical protein
METTVVNITIISWSTIRPVGDILIEEINRALLQVSASALLKTPIE